MDHWKDFERADANKSSSEVKKKGIYYVSGETKNEIYIFFNSFDVFVHK